jgi:hypothetical protein
MKSKIKLSKKLQKLKTQYVDNFLKLKECKYKYCDGAIRDKENKENDKKCKDKSKSKKNYYSKCLLKNIDKNIDKNEKHLKCLNENCKNKMKTYDNSVILLVKEIKKQSYFKKNEKDFNKSQKVYNECKNKNCNLNDDYNIYNKCIESKCSKENKLFNKKFKGYSKREDKFTQNILKVSNEN